MTAEVAIINRAGIALAADSAVTVGRERVWKTTNKLFSLSPKNDIGIMVYGSGDFIGYPWDTVIKEFRRSSDHKRFRTVDEAAEAFFAFLLDDRFENGQAKSLSFLTLFLELAETIAEEIQYDGKLDFRQKFVKLTAEYIENYQQSEICATITRTDFDALYAESVVDIFKDIFKQTFTIAMRKAACTLCYEALRRAIATSYSTGIVFAGFGHEELLPHLRDFTLDGRDGQIIRRWKTRSWNLNGNPDAPGGAIVPFGQSDMAYLFMEGTNIGQEQYVEATLREVLSAKSSELVRAYVGDADERVVEAKIQKDDDAKIVKNFMEEYHSYRKKRVVQPVMQVVSSLPKEEMAAMAEALVDITGLRRKVDSRIESVSGPIDVAFISKGDGFIWMKRKHYFELKLNGDFAVRKANELSGGQ